MKRLFCLLVLALVATFAHAQTGHSVVLNWSASPDSTATNPGAVTVYRANAVCPASGIGTLSYTALTVAAPAAGPFTDSTVTAGQWCYYITFSVGGLTSTASNTAGVAIVPLAPGTLKIGSSE